MPKERAKPADVILDLLRGASRTGRSASYLIETGELFGFTDNTVRVTLSRLIRRGLIESPGRGQYRLAAVADPVNEFVNRWRLGEERVTPWDTSGWLLLHTEATTQREQWVLGALGFRAARPALYVRPDNLSDTDSLLERGHALGLASDAILIRGTSHAAGNWAGLWDRSAIESDYAEMIGRLTQSAARLGTLPIRTARLESFRLGGAGINLLAKDPLLPAQMIDVDARKSLWTAMISYDELGKRVWAHGLGASVRGERLPVPLLAESMMEPS